MFCYYVLLKNCHPGMVQVSSQTMLKLSKAHLCKIVTSHKISYDKIGICQRWNLKRKDFPHNLFRYSKSEYGRSKSLYATETGSRELMDYYVCLRALTRYISISSHFKFSHFLRVWWATQINHCLKLVGSLDGKQYFRDDWKSSLERFL